MVLNCNCNGKYPIHIIVQVITKRADGIELFSIIILATVVYAVYDIYPLLTKFSEENLKYRLQHLKNHTTVENLVKTFDSAKKIRDIRGSNQPTTMNILMCESFQEVLQSNPTGIDV